MKITIANEDYEISPELAKKLQEIFGELPVKKTEKKKDYILYFKEESEIKSDIEPVVKYFNIPPATAHKLSEAISALVEYVQGPSNVGPEWNNRVDLLEKAREAAESFQESQ